MITAGLTPGCPAAAHRLLALLMIGRAAEPLSWSPLVTMLALALPIGLLTVAAVWCWRSHRRWLSASLLFAAYALHPPSVLPLVALYPRSGRMTSSGRLSPLTAVLLFAVTAVGLFVLTPDCAAGAERPPLKTIAQDAGLVFAQAVGLLIALLALSEVVIEQSLPDVRRAVVILGLSIVSAFITPAFDRRLTLVPGVVVCWWLAGRGAHRLVRDPPSWAARIATLLVLALIPVLTVAEVATTAPPLKMQTTWPALSATLAGIRRPAAVVSADAALSPWIAAWRAGLADGAHSLAMVSPDSVALAHAMETREVFAFDSERKQLSEAGVVFGLAASTGGAKPPLLWRVVDYVPCAPLSTAWNDITPQADMAQVTIRTSSATARAMTVVYAAQPGSLPAGRSVALANGGSMTLRGARLREFDLTRANDRTEFAAAAVADGLDAAGWINEAGFVSRVVIEHEPNPESHATLTFAAPPRRAAARAERPPRWPGSVSVCRSATAQPVLGYAGAPGEVAMNADAETWRGRGWHAPESEGGIAFRWTSEPHADIQFYIVRPVTYLVSLGLMPTADDPRGALVLAVNGRTLARAPQPDTWYLPAAALHRGSNTLSLDAPVVPAPAGDPRRLGLKVRSIVLHRQGGE